MTLRKSNWSDLAKTTSNPRLHKWRNMSTPVKNISKMFSRVNLLISHFQTFKCSVNVSIMILSKKSSKMNLISSHFGENYILSDLNNFFSAQNFKDSLHLQIWEGHLVWNSERWNILEFIIQNFLAYRFTISYSLSANILGQGMGKGRDGTVPRFLSRPACPVRQPFGTVPLVPQTSVPVPVSRDAKSVGTDRDSSCFEKFKVCITRRNDQINASNWIQEQYNPGTAGLSRDWAGFFSRNAGICCPAVF